MQARYRRTLPEDPTMRHMALASYGFYPDDDESPEIRSRTPPPWHEFATPDQRVHYRPSAQPGVRIVPPVASVSVRNIVRSPE